QVRQRKQGQYLRGVLSQPPIAHLGVAELALHHPERMLHLGAQAGLAVLPPLGMLALALVLHRLDRRRLLRDQEAGNNVLHLFALVGTGVAAVAAYSAWLICPSECVFTASTSASNTLRL